MPWRHPNLWAQQVAPKGLPCEGARRRRETKLPSRPPRETRPASGAGRSELSRAWRGGTQWWQDSSAEFSPTEAGVGVRSPQVYLPTLRTKAPRAAQSRTGLRSLLLPPQLQAGAPRTPAPPHPRPTRCEDPCSGWARKSPDSLGALLGECLPSKFREFLRQLGAEWAEQPQPPTPSEPQHQRGVSSAWQGPSPQRPNCSFLPGPRGQSSNLQNSLKDILLDQTPTLGPLRKDPEPLTKLKKANRPHGLQTPKLKAVLTPNPSEEGPGHHRRCCPFRVRFADETLWDTALRYWERSCALQQGITESRPATDSPASERVSGGVGRWLDSLPKAPDSEAREEVVPRSSFSWDSPDLPIPELQDHPSEAISMSSSLPYIPRATTQRQGRDHKTFLGAHSILDQVGKSPSSWSQKLESFLPHLELPSILNRGHPKGYQPFRSPEPGVDMGQG